MKQIIFSIIIVFVFNQLSAQTLVENYSTEIPFRYVTKIKYEKHGKIRPGGTGFFISKRCILTNVHLVINQMNKEPFAKIEIYVGYNDETGEWLGKQEIEPVLGENLFIPDDALFPKGDGFDIYLMRDYAMLVLPDESLNSLVAGEDETPYFEMLNVSQAQLIKNTRLNQAGYPGWRRTDIGRRNGRLYWFRPKYKKIYASKPRSVGIIYKVNGRGGNSGSPIWIEKDGKIYVVAVHRSGVKRTRRAFGVPFTDEVLEQIYEWLEEVEG